MKYIVGVGSVGCLWDSATEYDDPQDAIEGFFQRIEEEVELRGEPSYVPDREEVKEFLEAGTGTTVYFGTYVVELGVFNETTS